MVRHDETSYANLGDMPPKSFTKKKTESVNFCFSPLRALPPQNESDVCPVEQPRTLCPDMLGLRLHVDLPSGPEAQGWMGCSLHCPQMRRYKSADLHMPSA